MNASLWQLAGWTMIHSLWLGAAAALAGGFLRFACRRAMPNTRYAISLGTLALLATTPIAAAAWLSINGVPQLAHINPSPRYSGERLGEGQNPLSITPQTSATVENPSPNSSLQERGISDHRSPITHHPQLIDLAHSTPAELDALATQQQSPHALPTDSPATFRLPPSPFPLPPTSHQSQVASHLINLLPTLWLIGAPLTFTLLATGLVGSERLRRRATPLLAGSAFDACQRLRQTLSIPRRVALAMSDDVAQPILVGIVRPLILLPTAALAGWTPEQLDMVLLHELAHVRRWDNLVNLLQRIVESILFFHPAVWLVSRQVRRDREECCDAAVIRHTDRPEAYATLLIDIASRLRLSGQLNGPQSLAVASAMASHPLAGRIRRILNIEAEPMRITRRTLAATLLLPLLLAAAIFYSGASAQDPPPSKGGARGGISDASQPSTVASDDRAQGGSPHDATREVIPDASNSGTPSSEPVSPGSPNQNSAVAGSNADKAQPAVEETFPGAVPTSEPEPPATDLQDEILRLEALVTRYKKEIAQLTVFDKLVGIVGPLRPHFDQVIRDASRLDPAVEAANKQLANINEQLRNMAYEATTLDVNKVRQLQRRREEVTQQLNNAREEFIKEQHALVNKFREVELREACTERIRRLGEASKELATHQLDLDLAKKMADARKSTPKQGEGGAGSPNQVHVTTESNTPPVDAQGEALALQNEIRKLEELTVKAQKELVDFEVYKELIGHGEHPGGSELETAITEELDRDAALNQYKQQLFELNTTLQTKLVESKTSNTPEIKRLRAVIRQVEAEMAKYQSEASRTLREKYAHIPKNAKLAAEREYNARRQAIEDNLAEYQRRVASCKQQLAAINANADAPDSPSQGGPATDSNADQASMPQEKKKITIIINPDAVEGLQPYVAENARQLGLEFYEWASDYSTLTVSGDADKIDAFDGYLKNQKIPERPQTNFPTLENQKIADRAYKLLGLELEPLTPEELERVKKLGYNGGLRVASIQPGMRSHDCESGDLLVGLHVWPVADLASLDAILTRDDLGDLNPLKYYVVRSSDGGGYGNRREDRIATGRLHLQPGALASPDKEQADRDLAQPEPHPVITVVQPPTSTSTGLFGGNSQTTAYLRVTASKIFDPHQRLGGADIMRHYGAQITLIQSKSLLQQVVSSKSVAELPTVKNQDEPVAWLQQRLRAHFPGEGEILELRLEGGVAAEDEAILQAVIDHFIKAMKDLTDAPADPNAAAVPPGDLSPYINIAGGPGSPNQDGAATGSNANDVQPTAKASPDAAAPVQEPEAPANSTLHIEGFKLTKDFPAGTDRNEIEEFEKNYRNQGYDVRVERHPRSGDFQVLVAKRIVAEPVAPLTATATLRPGDEVVVKVAGAFPEAPIEDLFPIEPEGTIALGPLYGRVAIAGKTVSEAEAAVQEHLGKTLTDVAVQLTFARSHPLTPPVEDEIDLEPTFLYDGKTFEEWRDLWKLELNPERRTEAINALAAFGRAGRGQEAADAILAVAGEYGDDYSDSSPEGKLLKAIRQAVARMPANEWMPQVQERIAAAGPEQKLWIRHAENFLGDTRDSSGEARRLAAKFAEIAGDELLDTTALFLFRHDQAFSQPETIEMMRRALQQESTSIDVTYLGFRHLDKVPEQLDVLLRNSHARSGLIEQAARDRNLPARLYPALLEVLKNPDRAADHVGALRAIRAIAGVLRSHDAAEGRMNISKELTEMLRTGPDELLPATLVTAAKLWGYRDTQAALKSLQEQGRLTPERMQQLQDLDERVLFEESNAE